MERLTDNTNYCTSWSDCEMPEGACVFLENCYDRKIYNKLREYEDAEEQGLLIRLPCKYVYFLVDVNSKFGGMVMKKPIKDLTLFEIEQVDKRKYYSAKEEAEAALAEMEG